MAEVSRGAAGEVLAARFLREKGYTLLTANYRCRQGEVDIIATDASYIVFVEVKTRQQGALYAPREAVDAAKQRRIIATAMQYLQRYPTPLQPRFDVVEVVTKRNQPLQAVQIDHYLGAYEAGSLREAF